MKHFRPTTGQINTPRLHSSHLPKSRQGMVLIIVAVVTAMVSLSALGFLVSMRSENLAAHLQADQMQVNHVNASAVEFLHELASLSRAERSLLRQPSGSDPFRDVHVDWDPMGSRHGRFSILFPVYEEESADAVFQFGVQSTSAKISLAQLLAWDVTRPGHARQALMNLPGMTENLADSLLDWIDADDEPREFGAESEFYLGLDPPRQPPNQIPPHISGLLSVRGMSEWQLLGNLNGMQRVLVEGEGSMMTDMADDVEAPLTQARETWQTVAPPWSYYLTTVSAERNVTNGGARRIDLNQTDLARLRRQLTAAFDQETAEFVTAIRKIGPSEVAVANASQEPVPTQIAASDGDFTFDSPLDLVDMVVTIEQPASSGSSSEASSKSYRSPFTSSDTASREKLVQFLDHTTTTQAVRIEGRIDILTAPRPVLLAIPDLSSDTVDRILSARDGTTMMDASRTHAVWLYAEGIVELATMRQLLPYVTVGGDILSAQTVAYYDAQSPWSRSDVMIDGSTKASKTLYYRDLGRLGRGFRFTDLMSEQPPTPPTDRSNERLGASRRRFQR